MSYQQFADERGFTLIELLTVIVIIGLLAAIAIPEYNQYKKRSRIAEVAVNLRNFESAYWAYNADNGDFPGDTHRVLPAGMGTLISSPPWGPVNTLGGFYNWEGPDNYSYSGISIESWTAPLQDFLILDRMLDDGQITVGRFRLTPNGRYTYVIDE